MVERSAAIGGASGRKEDVQLEAVPGGRRWSLRASSDHIAELEAAWGAPIPRAPLTSASGGDQVAMRLGPDEWFLLAASGTAVHGLSELGQSPPFSLVDVSDRHLAWNISGPRAAEALTTCCPLDLSARAFPARRATRTVYGKAEILLWRPSAEPLWRIEAARSFSDYLMRLLARSIADL